MICVCIFRTNSSFKDAKVGMEFGKQIDRKKVSYLRHIKEPEKRQKLIFDHEFMMEFQQKYGRTT